MTSPARLERQLTLKIVRVLLIGPMPPPVGGTRISFQRLVDQLGARKDLNITVINRSPVRSLWVKGLARTACDVFRIASKCWSVDVIALHCSLTALNVIGPLVSGISIICRKPYIIRVFGGRYYQDVFVNRSACLARWSLSHAHLYLAETKHVVNSAREDGLLHTQWFPTTRPKIQARPEPNDNRSGRRCRRFVFLGHIRIGKGILEIVEAGKRFDGTNVEIDVYGPARHDLDVGIFQNVPSVRYKGVVAPESVPRLLLDYDCLLLPTRLASEGYPGVILEAFAAGLPVICTDMKSLRELVDDRCGLVVPAGDSERLYAAMKILVDDQSLFLRLREGAEARSLQFDDAAWAQTFGDWCCDAAFSRSGNRFILSQSIEPK